MSPRPTTLVALSLALSGCYASHERGAGSGGACGPVDTSCFATLTPTRGVCVIDGQVFAFTDGTGDVSCRGEDGDATRRGYLLACGPSGPLARRVGCCSPSDDPLTLGWVFAGRVEGTALGVEEDGEDACLMVPDGGYPIGPFMPWAPTELCDDPLGWPGVPLVFSVRVPGADGCADSASHQEVCRAHVDGARIVVALSIAPSEVRTCAPSTSDDVAHCAVLPLAAGSYEVFDTSGRRLGSVAVPDAPPSPREPICTPIPG